MRDDAIITWTPEKLSEFKDEYAKHQRDPTGTFKFEDHNFVVGYARYLIQHIERKFAGSNEDDRQES
jgi:hypothetical protein